MKYTRRMSNIEKELLPKGGSIEIRTFDRETGQAEIQKTATVKKGKAVIEVYKDGFGAL